MQLLHKMASAALLVFAVTVPASASPHDDLAYAVQENNGDKTSGWIVERLMTLEIGDKCYAKVLDKKNAALSKISSDARYIERFAKVMTGDDWTHIEGQGANSKEANRAIVDKMIDAFKPKFHLTVRVDGSDCEASGSALWIKYTSHIVIALEKYPPKSGKLNVVINVRSKTKGLTVDVDKDGMAFTINGSLDIEPNNDWGGTIDKALKRISTKN
jgi:hypothetical protein